MTVLIPVAFTLMTTLTASHSALQYVPQELRELLEEGVAATMDLFHHAECLADSTDCGLPVPLWRTDGDLGTDPIVVAQHIDKRQVASLVARYGRSPEDCVMSLVGLVRGPSGRLSRTTLLSRRTCDDARADYYEAKAAEAYWPWITGLRSEGFRAPDDQITHAVEPGTVSSGATQLARLAGGAYIWLEQAADARKATVWLLSGNKKRRVGTVRVGQRCDPEGHYCVVEQASLTHVFRLANGRLSVRGEMLSAISDDPARGWSRTLRL